MADHAGGVPRPSPQAAYARWIEMCTRAGWRGAPAAEQVPVTGALGRVTAAPVRAHWPSPRYACAAMDGIALSAAAAGDATGRWPLHAGAFTWVDTGDLVPEGRDTVVERERIEPGADGSVWVTGPAPAGLHVRAAGEDFLAGQLLLPAGHWLRGADLAAAAMAGHTTLEVARRPVVAVIPTGNEVRSIGAPLQPGDVIDTNSLMLASRAAETGAEPVLSEIRPDVPGVIAAEVRRAARTAGLVLIIAGSSAGRRDHTASVLAEVGGVTVRGAAIRPGHPVLLGYAIADAGPATAVPVIGVPGYPMAAAVIFELFAMPLLATLQGTVSPVRMWQRVRLACDWTSSPDVEDWVPVSVDRETGPVGGGAQGGLVATPGRHGAASLSRLIRADAWWPIPIGEAKFTRGEYIDILPIPGSPTRST